MNADLNLIQIGADKKLRNGKWSHANVPSND